MKTTAKRQEDAGHEWLTAKELAARERIGRTTLYRWLAEGILERRALTPRTVRFRLRPRPDLSWQNWPQDSHGQHVKPL